MKFPSLEIENFLALSSAKLSLADRGLVLIQGINHDDTSAESNGSGKSSIADALCWCLYGTTARGVTGDDVINNNVGKGTRVTTVIDDGNDRYWISRHRKHKTGKNGLTVTTADHAGTQIVLTQGTDKLTQLVVDKILGCSYDVFKNSIYAGQEQMPDLPAMTDKALKLLIEEASGVTLLEEAYKVALKEHLNVRGRHDEIAIRLQKHAERKSWVEDQVLMTSDTSELWIEDQAKRYNEAIAAVKKRVAEIKLLDVEIAKIDPVALNQEIAACEAKIAGVADEQRKLVDFHKKASQCQGQVSILENSLVRIKTAHDRQKQGLANIDHKVGCPCDDCGRPITAAEIAPARAAAEIRLAEIVTEFNAAKKLLESAVSDAGIVAGERDTFQATMSDVSAESAQRASLAAQIGAYNQLVNQRKGLADLARMVGAQAKAIQAETNPHVPTLAKLGGDVLKLETSITTIAKELDVSAVEVDLAAEVAKVYSPAGARAHILDDVTPFLNTATSEYLSVLSDGNINANWTTLVRNSKGELREKFSIEVEKVRAAKVFGGLSGGEKRKARVATALALQDLVATRATKPIDLFIADEIDDALDSPGLERLTDILTEKAKKRGSVFVISHNALTDWIPNIVQIEKKNDQTVLTEFTA